MSWLSFIALVGLIMGLHTFLHGPREEWPEKKLVFEFIISIATIVITSWHLLTHGIQP